MTLVLIALAALAASAVSLLSGFGLGTVLLPVFALFLPLPVAVGATAVVHLASNAAKLLLMARHARAPVVLRFGIPAAFAALGGAALLGWIDRIPPLGAYAIGGRVFEIVAVKALIGSLMIAFAVLELLPRAASASVPARWMPLGGLLSGFFGGLSGHQGALRSMFLLRAGLTKEQFVATGVVCAAMVDVARLSVYGPGVFRAHLAQSGEAIAPVAVACAFSLAGLLAGRAVLRRITFRAVQRIVAVLVLAIGAALAAGVL